jgi:hypothetical protein
MNAFSARLNAVEGSYFLTEQNNATKKHLEMLVEQGKLPASALEHLPLSNASQMAKAMGQIPATIINSRPASEVIFSYTGVPAPRMSTTESWARLGTTKVSLGRAKWSADGASIFSVNDGKRLAQTPVREPSAWEASRAHKIAQAAQVDKRVVQGIRLMPEYTPGRAMLWGSIMAMWATGAVTASVARSLDIHTAEEASEKLRSAFEPFVLYTHQFFQPIKGWFADQDTSGLQTFRPVQELSRRMRNKLGHEQQHQ